MRLDLVRVDFERVDLERLNRPHTLLPLFVKPTSCWGTICTALGDHEARVSTHLNKL